MYDLFLFRLSGIFLDVIGYDNFYETLFPLYIGDNIIGCFALAVSFALTFLLDDAITF